MTLLHRIPLLTVAVAVVALAAAGCGGSSSSSSGSGSGSGSTGSSSAPASSSGSSGGGGGGGGQVVKLSADPSGALKFTTTTLHAKAGKVTLDMLNPSSVPHSIAVKGNGVSADAPETSVGQGQHAKVTTTLKPGKYTFFCPVPGHEQAGMKGTLIVR